MKNYSANLYKKFRTRTMNTLDGDNFYEYFMRVVESGHRTYGQKNIAMIKSIDEAWVTAIEGALPCLETIIKKPRRFIRREENIVPIELARKVGSDAVKHLATHTHYISRIDKNNNVIPNKILNVYNDESLDIYENRFIISLLTKINQFLDRRYDALFGTTGDEFESVLKVDSAFNDNDEKIEYNLTIKLHQGQTYFDNQNNDPKIYERIEHIRLMMSSFKKSEFFQNLAACTQVTSPISRTNLITKEPNFKRCYELWTFLERYKEVGYTIEKREFTVDFSERYLDELNTIVLFNYLVMKNNLEDVHNKPIDITQFKKRRVIKPKFIANIIEELVSDYDIPENQLKQVFEEEVARAYNLKKSQEEEVQAALAKALNVELEKKKEEQQEAQVREILEKALGTEIGKREAQKQSQEEKILSILESTLGAHKAKKEEEKQEEQILDVLQRALGAHQEKKAGETKRVSALEEALGKKARKDENEE